MTPNVEKRMARARRACRGLLAALPLVCGLASAAAAQPSDPARCEALHLKKESSYYQCIGRCDQRAANAGVDQDSCEARCERFFNAAQDRIDQRAPCMPEIVPEDPPPEPTPVDPSPRHTPDPNPQQCEAQALQVEVRHLICVSRCESAATRDPEADTAACTDRCDTRAAASMDRTMARPVCALGRMADGQSRAQ